MTNNTIDALNEQISALTITLNKHRDDVALLQRLKDAPANVKAITAELDGLTDKLNKAMADADKAKRADFAAGFRKMAVIQTGEGTGLHARYTITYQTLRWNGYDNEWQESSIAGFAALEQNAMRYLLEFAPEKLPAFVAELAPGDPYEAMNKYLMAMRRGFLSA